MSLITRLTKSHVLATFLPLTAGDPTSFFANIIENVSWTVTGTAHPLAGHWTSKDQFYKDSWTRIGKVLEEPMQLSVMSVIIEPEEGEGKGLRGKAVVELVGVGGVLRNGMEYNNQYCWVMEFNEEGKIKSVRAYLDTAKLRDALALEENIHVGLDGNQAKVSQIRSEDKLMKQA